MPLADLRVRLKSLVFGLSAEGEVKAQGADTRIPKLYVDVSIISRHDAGTGIQRVVRAISDQLCREAPARHEVIFVAGSRNRQYRQIGASFLSGHGRAGWGDTSAIDAMPGDIFLGLDLASRILPRRRRQIEQWRSRGVRIAVVVYDLLPISNPEWFDENQVLAFRNWLQCIARYCDNALCISHTVKRSLEDWMEATACPRVRDMHVSVIPLGGDIPSSNPSLGMSDDDRAALQRLDGKPFILMVGTIEPRKGHRFVLDAFDHLLRHADRDIPALVVVGRPGWKTDDLQARMRSHAERGQRFFWLDAATDEFLDRLYQTCTGVIFPTLAEGFGLPLAEAIAHGRPVLVRDLPVFRENDWDGISYFSDDRPAEFSNKIVEWLDTCQYRQFSEKDHKITWHNACTKMLNILESA